VARTSAKFNLGRALSADKRAAVTGVLTQRGCPLDHRTAAAMDEIAGA